MFQKGVNLDEVTFLTREGTDAQAPVQFYFWAPRRFGKDIFLMDNYRDCQYLIIKIEFPDYGLVLEESEVSTHEVLYDDNLDDVNQAKDRLSQFTYLPGYLTLDEIDSLITKAEKVIFSR